MGVRVCVAVAAAFALAAFAVQARQEEFMDDLGSSGMSVGAVQVLMIGLGLLMAALAPFERYSYGDGWRGRAVACALYLAFAALAWWSPAPAMILCVVAFAVVMAVASR